MTNKRGEETRKLIKKCACSLFASKGFKQVTMKDICEAASLSRGGLYCHYESTREIFKEIINDFMSRHEDTFSEKIAQNIPAKEILDEVLEKYKTEVVPALIKEFGYKNINEVPKLEKIVLNMGLGEVKGNSKSFNIAVDELAVISGQKPVVTTAKKSISNFALREGQKIGAKVTLRGERMYEFFDRLTAIALPKVRDFRGINEKSFDGRGNYSMGIKEQLIFPEIVYEKVEKIRGFDITFVTTAKTDEEAKALLKALGLPFAK